MRHKFSVFFFSPSPVQYFWSFAGVTCPCFVSKQGVSGMMKSLSVVVMPTHMIPARTATAPGTMAAYFEQIEVRIFTPYTVEPFSHSFIIVFISFVFLHTYHIVLY